jgi:hypothetical protein
MAISLVPNLLLDFDGITNPSPSTPKAVSGHQPILSSTSPLLYPFHTRLSPSHVAQRSADHSTWRVQRASSISASAVHKTTWGAHQGVEGQAGTSGGAELDSW